MPRVSSVTPRRDNSYLPVMQTSSLRPALRLLAFLVLAVSATGCSDLGPQDELLRNVESARARWNASRLDPYTYGLYRICECTPEMAGPVSVLVQGVSPVGWTYQDGSTVPASLRPHFPSVDGLLDMLEDAIRAGAWEVTVQYDAATGVPLQFRIDYDQFVFDDEDSYRVVAMPRAPGT
jgi:hypothetical protein